MDVVTAKESEQSDADIIRLVLGGRKDEFRELVLRHQGKVYAMVMRQVGDPATASDLTQEIFIKAYKALPKFRFEARFSTWLTRITINSCNSFFSSRRYKEQLSKIQLSEEALEQLEQRNDQQDDIELRLKRLRAAIATLKPKYREVVVLCALEQTSYKDAAGLLGIPYGTVCSRMNKAFLLLRNKLEGNK